MKIGQLMEYNKRNIFLRELCRKRGKDTIVPDLLLFFKKA